MNALRCHRIPLVAGITLLLLLTVTANAAESTSTTVLQGFTPITFDAERMEARLYERTYRWNNSLIPLEIVSRGLSVATSIRFVWSQQNQRKILTPTSTEVIEATPTRVVVRAISKPTEAVDITVTTALEYDGVATITVGIDAKDPIKVDLLALEIYVPRQNTQEILAFREETIRSRDVGRHDILGSDDVLTLPYSGDLLNVINFSDGDRSLWWFADNAVDWDWADSPTTEVTGNGETITLRQNLLGKNATLAGKKTIQFGLLATPVRPLAKDWRKRRMTWWLPTAIDKKLSANIFSYWEQGLAYDGLPYASYPARVSGRLPPSDRARFAGATANKAYLKKYRDDYSADLLPYYPLHLLSTVDPVVAENRADWETQPPEVWRDMVGGYPFRFDKIQISLRAPGVTSHIINGLSSAIDELDANGFYFDHGMIKNSSNPANGGWIDCKGKRRGSLDIWATRDFFRRLRGEFERRNKPGITIVHDSNREIIPAYTFAFGLLDGEHFRNRLREGDYLEQTSLTQFRARFSPDQYGIPTYWLAEEWFNHTNVPNWYLSEESRTAYRRMMGLALLHDVLDWPHSAHPGERQQLLDLLDKFGIADSKFRGYWSGDAKIQSDDRAVLISTYVNTETHTNLHVVFNSGTFAKQVQLQTNTIASVLATSNSPTQVLAQQPGYLKVNINARDFLLFTTVDVESAAPPSAPVDVQSHPIPATGYSQ